MDEKGYSANIDHIYVCVGGIFVIETKSNKGEVIGDANDDEWVAIKRGWQADYEKPLKNPIKQNQVHINHLKRMMGQNPPKMYSVIVFPVADSVDVDNTNVFDLNSARDFFIEKIKNGRYSQQFIEKINRKLRRIIDEYGISLEQHIANIHNRNNS